jgi:hypothetical protein
LCQYRVGFSRDYKPLSYPLSGVITVHGFILKSKISGRPLPARSELSIQHVWRETFEQRNQGISQ